MYISDNLESKDEYILSLCIPYLEDKSQLFSWMCLHVACGLSNVPKGFA